MTRARRIFLTALLVAITPLLWAQTWGVQGVDAAFTTTVPLGDYRDVSTVGFGFNTQLQTGLAPQAGPQVLLDLSGVYNITPESGTGLWDLAPAVGGGFYGAINDEWSWGAQGGYGFMVHYVTGDWESGVEGPEFYSDQFFYVAGEMAWTVTDRGSIFLRPRYSWFIEEDAHGHVIAADLGYRFFIGGE